MKRTEQNIASYEIMSEEKGVRFNFLCGLSGMSVCVSSLYKKGNEASLVKSVNKAWNKDVKSEFNRCSECGLWVSDIMYNADVLKCVACAPWEDIPEYCPLCGAKVDENIVFCVKCGVRLMYGGDVNAGE